ncbi:hypothetical protein RUM44_005683 [Polyplax serrata]|uniref:Hyaluronan-mediated motility receptor C-terminal domain-containing protein n=1 Tax=Polyplax serrata TaxID=468196 RepID=A0ABR1AXU0_POLSC
MSFPRAKLQRFNDVLNNVPSPTKYDPKLGDKVKGGCILKGETKQSAVSDTGSVSSGKSCQTPVFRTPQVPKRHNCLGISEKGSHSAHKSISFRTDDIEVLHNDAELEELKSLRVECCNKTETITDLEKHIQDLKGQISNQEKSKAKLEAYITELEVAKSNLECIKSNNENYEQQIDTLQSEIKGLESKTQELIKQKEELITKIDEGEKKNNNLEESNLDYERKLINLEGTIEQLQMELKNREQLITELKQKEEIYKMNHQVSIECLQGKISTLENEIKEMDRIKSKNEAVIFGLETQISNLNCTIENLKTEKNELELTSNGFKVRLEDTEKNCKNHNDTITGLEMELESRVQQLEQLKDSNSILKAERDEIKIEIEKEKAVSEERLNDLIAEQEQKLKELEKKFNDQITAFDSERKELETERTMLVNSHAQEILHLQNEYETKLLTQMQENTDKINVLQCQLDEKDALLKKAKGLEIKLMMEWEEKFWQAESNFSDLVTKLGAEHLEVKEAIKESYAKKLRAAEINSSRIIDMKNKEIDIVSEQYREMLEEVKCLLNYLEKKDDEIKELSSGNKNLNSRVKMMLEEIKILNEENEMKCDSLTKMTKKYNEEFSKNEQLSCKLGELDTKLYHLRDDLNKKIEDWKKSSDELKKSRHAYDRLNIKKCDLEKVVFDLQGRIDKLLKELDEQKAAYDENIRKVGDELTMVRTQCKKFEIVAGNTSKSLDALRERLIESEKEVEKLNLENTSLTKDVQRLESEKNDFQAKLEDMVETKIDLETALDEYLSNNRELSEKCSKLESLCNNFETKIEDLTRLNTDLETEKRKHMEAMKNLIKQQELQMIETERNTLDQVEQFNETLTEKLEFFVKFSTDKFKIMSLESQNLKAENEKVTESLKIKSEDYDNLFTDYEILKTTVDISVKESENLKNKCEEQASEMEKLKNTLNELKLRTEEAESKISDKDHELLELIDERSELKKRLNENLKLLEAIEDSNTKFKEQLSVMESEAEDRETEMKKKAERMENIELKIQEFEDSIRQKDAEIAICQEEKMLCMQELKTLSWEKNDLAFNLKMAKSQFEANEKLVEELRAEKIDAEELLNKQKLEYNNLVLERRNLESEFLLVKEENDKLRREMAMLSQLTERKTYYKDNCLRLDKLCEELKDENTSLKNDFNEIHCVLKDKERTVEELTKRCADLESLIGPFRDQLERYETERMMIENDREELRKQHLEQAAELGHRNHKQKIQHVVNLKNTLLETRKENEKLMLEIKNLKKKVQKLQEELGHDPKRLFIGGRRPSTTPFKGKENSGLMTPAPGILTPMTQVKQEPMSPGSPLRNRNQ